MNRLVSRARRRHSPDGLLREWHRRTTAGPWRVDSDWLCPEVMSLVRAAHGMDAGRTSESRPGIRSEVRALGRARAAHGVGAAEAVADLFAFYDALGMAPSGPLTAAFAEAWGEATAVWAPSISCVDPATGLSTWGHFRSRLYELYADGAASPEDRIIAMLRLPAGTPALSSAGWALQDRVGRTVRGAFAGLGAVLSGVDACVVVLMPRSSESFAALGMCHEELDAALGAEGGGCRIDVEPLPETVEGVDRVLDSLHR